MRKLLLALIALIAVTAIADPPAPLPVTIEIRDAKGKKLEVFRANARTFRLTFTDGGTATDISGILLEMSGRDSGKETALEILRRGKAEKKLREIIEAQGGDPSVEPEDIEVGDQTFTARSESKGYLLWLTNASLAEIARLAGAPKDKGAGIYLHKKVGDTVKKNEPLLTIYAERNLKLQRALDELERTHVLGVGQRMEMLIHEVKERPVHKKTFMIER